MKFALIFAAVATLVNAAALPGDAKKPADVGDIVGDLLGGGGPVPAPAPAPAPVPAPGVGVITTDPNVGVTLPGVTLPGVNTQLPGTVLPGVTLPGVTLPGVNLPGTVAPGVTLPGVTLPGVNTQLPGVTMPGVTMPGVTAPYQPQPLPQPQQPYQPQPQPQPYQPPAPTYTLAGGYVSFSLYEQSNWQGNTYSGSVYVPRGTCQCAAVPSNYNGCASSAQWATTTFVVDSAGNYMQVSADNGIGIYATGNISFYAGAMCQGMSKSWVLETTNYPTNFAWDGIANLVNSVYVCVN
ncbi:hypothetical protein GQ42DRAFT_158413 [Ramicandelaber brevisporus]|nr:hypothetical protein GQ42DRAFT_158413 [Ramicandelaber brevisporus]